MENITFQTHAEAEGKNRVLSLDKTYRNILLSVMKELQGGYILLQDGAHVMEIGDPSSANSVRLRIHTPAFYKSVLFGGTIGAGESYMRGDWSCDNLAALIQIIVRNQEVVKRLDSGFAFVTRPFHFMYDLLRRNTRSGSRKNISAHYDLGNDFYELFLDPTMAYSSGLFERQDYSMQDASEAKMDRLCRLLKLSPEDHLLEIGTGWGGLAVYAAKHYGCRVTTTTISRAQYEYSRKRVTDEGLDGRVTLLLDDYRDLQGKFDKIVSVEMIEAVGHQYYKTFFGKCSDLLAEGGLFAMQAITIRDQEFNRYKDEVDFIKRYIFPGGCLPSISAIANSLTAHTDMVIEKCDNFADDYARTLVEWRKAFDARRNEIRGMGYTESFCRMWEFYLCYCEAGFREKHIGLAQVLMQKR